MKWSEAWVNDGSPVSITSRGSEVPNLAAKKESLHCSYGLRGPQIRDRRVKLPMTIPRDSALPRADLDAGATCFQNMTKKHAFFSACLEKSSAGKSMESGSQSAAGSQAAQDV